MASAVFAGAYAASGMAAGVGAASLYATPTSLNDITAGATTPYPAPQVVGSTTLLYCSTSYMCNAGPGYDGPTGLGTPNVTAMAATVS